MHTVRETEVAVVGAGLSGLVCARRLAAAGKAVVVLEASSRVGGRSRGSEIGGVSFDLGGQWIGPGQDRVAALTKELGIATVPTPHEGEHLLRTAGTLLRYRGTIPNLPLLDLALLGVATAKAYAMSWRLSSAGDPTRFGVRCDASSVEVIAGALTPRARGAFDAAFRTIFGAEPRDVSLLWYLGYLRAGGGFFRLVDVEGGAQERRLVGGAFRIPQRLAAELGEAVTLDTPVRRIRESAERDGIIVEGDHLQVRARCVVVAIPPSLSNAIAFDPPLPALRGELVAKMRMGATVKFHALYDRAFWRDAGLSGQAATDGLVSATFDNSSPPTSDGGRPHAALVGFVVGDAARAWGTRGEVERRAALLDELATLFGPSAREPSALVVHDWSSEAWTGGCPVDSPTPGFLREGIATLRSAHGRVLWAGTETATEHAGYFDGAVSSGERAAEEALALL